MTASTTIIAAMEDPDLRARFRALAIMEGIAQPDQFVAANLPALVMAPADENGATIDGVYEYALATYTPAPRPGEDLSKITDAHLLHAINSVVADNLGQ